jgi:hypothetical protein
LPGRPDRCALEDELGHRDHFLFRLPLHGWRCGSVRWWVP